MSRYPKRGEFAAPEVEVGGLLRGFFLGGGRGERVS